MQLSTGIDNKVIILQVKKMFHPLIVEAEDVANFLQNVSNIMDSKESVIYFSAELQHSHFFNSSNDLPSLEHLLKNIAPFAIIHASVSKKGTRPPRPEEIYMRGIKSGQIYGMNPPLVVEKNIRKTIAAFEQWKMQASAAVSRQGIKCPFCTKFIVSAVNGSADNFRRHLTDHKKKAAGNEEKLMDVQRLSELLKQLPKKSSQ